MAWQAGRFDVEAFAGEVDAKVVDDWVRTGDPLEQILSLLALGFAGVCRSNGMEVGPEHFLPHLAEEKPEQTIDEQMEAAERIFSQFQGA